MLYYITVLKEMTKLLEEADLLIMETVLVSKCGEKDLKHCGTTVKWKKNFGKLFKSNCALERKAYVCFPVIWSLAAV